MKKRTVLLSSLAFASILSATFWTTQSNKMKEEGPLYAPRNANAQNMEAKGSAEWLHAIRANPRTGEIDPQDVLQARIQTRQMRMQENVGELSWEELGPDNVGGRTRAFLIDRDNPNLLYAGGVSGGLFVSTTRGSSWQKVNDLQENLAIVSIAQAVNGDIYYGTGEGMYYFASGTGTGGILGGGLFRKKHDENDFIQIPSTTPTPSNSNNANFASIGFIITDQNDANKLWIGTNQGYYISTNAGSTWELAIPITGQATDGVMDKNGGHWISVGPRGFYSPTGNIGSFVEITRQPAAAGELPRSIGRMVFAVSPEDPNYVYCVQTTGFGSSNSQFHEAYRTTNGGQTWTRIGQRSASFNPHGRQGGFDHAVTVDAWNKDRVFVGGVDFVEWSATGGWQQVASRFRGSPFYVHVDHHRFVCDTTQPGLVYALNDGGIFRSNNFGNTWVEINKGYVTTQFYGIGFSSNGRKLMGGTQDNGTILIDGTGNTAKAGVRTPGIDYRGAIRDGDGGYAEISSINSNIMVKAMQHGILGRSNNNGETFNEFYNFTRMDPDRISPSLTPQFAPFVTPFLLLENQFDQNSTDSVRFIARDGISSIGFGLGRSNFNGFISRPQATAQFVPGTFRVIATPDTLLDDGNGNVIGAGSGTIDYTTGEYNITFSRQGGVSAQITAFLSVEYASGDTIFVTSNTQEVPIRHILPNGLNSNDTIFIQDQVQSIFAVGLTSTIANNGRLQGGIWLTRGLLDFSVAVPEWIQVAHFGGGTTGISPSALEFTPDGDALFVGTSNGRLFRISGMATNRDFASMDLSSPDYNLQVTEIANFSRFITGLAIDKTNPNRLIATLGGYGNSNNVRLTTNALDTGNVSFLAKGSGIPPMPVYDAIFNLHNPNEVIVGTDLGVFSTTNINSGNPTWAADNGEFANVPVFMLRQEQVVIASRDSINPRRNGILYAGTHGRGIWKTGSLAVDNPLSTVTHQEIKTEDQLLIFPNPTKDITTIRLELPRTGDVKISVRDMSGAQVRSATYKNLQEGNQDVEFSLEGLRSGTYVITVSSPAGTKTSKVVKL